MKKTAKELCAGIRVLQDEQIVLAETVLFIADKLIETQEAIKNEDLVIEYDNGGGQRGIRENPHYVAYEHLHSNYIKALKQLEDAVSKGAPNQQSSELYCTAFSAHSLAV